MPEVVSFHGTDGSGKSTIAKEFAALHAETDPIILGGSSYKTWLTPEVASLTLGTNHKIGEKAETDAEKTRLYEDIAIACYGYARILAEHGHKIVIDSDPYFKRIIWGSLANPENPDDYVRSFESRVREGLGNFEGPDAIVGVNLGDHAVPHDEMLKRLLDRGESTYNDPTELDSLIELDTQVNLVWAQMNLGAIGLSRYAGFNQRLLGTPIVSIHNPSCEPEQISDQARTIAFDIQAKIEQLIA